VEVVQLLLAAGANMHANNDEALQTASKYGRVEVVQMLLAAGATPLLFP
jgi:ankyrin repeat protein